MTPEPPTLSGTPFLCVVIPAYNEERRILPTLQEVTAYLATQQHTWEVLISDDGSTDATADLVRRYAAQQPGVRLISNPHGGKGAAVRAGMLQSRAQFRFICDADLSMPIAQLQRFLPPQLEGVDVALGSREAPGARRFNEPTRRHLLGRVYNGAARLLAVPGINDTQCGFKCFTSAAADRLFPLQRLPGFAFDVEVLFLAQRMGLRLVEVPIDWYYGAESKVRPIKHGLGMVRDILKVRWYALRGKYGSLKRQSAP